MTMVARLGLPEPVSISPILADRRARTLSDFELANCVRALDGWVAPEGLAPRAVLEQLVEQGLLEAWPGRPLYRAPRRAPSPKPGDAA